MSGNEDLELRIVALEKAVFENGLRDMQKSVEELNRIVNGDPKLDVPPLRSTVGKLDIAYKRAKWVVGTLAVSNVGGLIGIVSLLLGIGG